MTTVGSSSNSIKFLWYKVNTVNQDQLRPINIFAASRNSNHNRLKQKKAQKAGALPRRPSPYSLAKELIGRTFRPVSTSAR